VIVDGAYLTVGCHQNATHDWSEGRKVRNKLLKRACHFRINIARTLEGVSYLSLCTVWW
jgi:hypothetical protein